MPRNNRIKADSEQPPWHSHFPGYLPQDKPGSLRSISVRPSDWEDFEKPRSTFIPLPHLPQASLSKSIGKMNLHQRSNSPEKYGSVRGGYMKGVFLPEDVLPFGADEQHLRNSNHPAMEKIKSFTRVFHRPKHSRCVVGETPRAQAVEGSAAFVSGLLPSTCQHLGAHHLGRRSIDEPEGGFQLKSTKNFETAYDSGTGYAFSNALETSQNIQVSEPDEPFGRQSVKPVRDSFDLDRLHRRNKLNIETRSENGEVEKKFRDLKISDALTSLKKSATEIKKTRQRKRIESIKSNSSMPLIKSPEMNHGCPPINARITSDFSNDLAHSNSIPIIESKPVDNVETKVGGCTLTSAIKPWNHFPPNRSRLQSSISSGEVFDSPTQEYSASNLASSSSGSSGFQGQSCYEEKGEEVEEDEYEEDQSSILTLSDGEPDYFRYPFSLPKWPLSYSCDN